MIEYNGFSAENLSLFIKDKLAQIKMSQAELARHINVFPQYLSQSMNGSRPFPDNIRDAISKELNLSEDEDFFLKILQTNNNQSITFNIKEKDTNYIANLIKLKYNN